MITFICMKISTNSFSKRSNVVHAPLTLRIMIYKRMRKQLTEEYSIFEKMQGLLWRVMFNSAKECGLLRYTRDFT